MANPTEHHTKAEELLALARTYPHNSAARLATLTEAQVHATLYLSDLTAAIAAPVRFNLGTVPDAVHTGTHYITQALNIPLAEAAKPDADDHGTPPIPEVDAALKAPAKPRRTRKATPAKEADK
ncbi:hypothetical protein SEA_VRESIDENCE_51 [Arthrobacter phage VResidence]|uniref:Uncharacterized protein n=1 Tax=Arthrobacter phage VResidence TaxID=2927294 RepID=A0A9X9P6M0_9CAUD|nr:hypothetical protein SEA_VRESIDENCE_51 [Arthrobacter phage VResidence]